MSYQELRGGAWCSLRPKWCLHEIYFVSREEGVPLEEIATRTAALTAIENLS
ncbi:MAG: hypothetical protein QXS68_01890 [Candidatus Methanomethylicaceae archaeon]